MTSNHFRNRQQESQEEAPRAARDAHHQVLVAGTLLEDHIKRLGHPSLVDGLAILGNQVVASICIVEDAQGGTCWLVVKSRSPQQQPKHGIL